MATIGDRSYAAFNWQFLMEVDEVLLTVIHFASNESALQVHAGHEDKKLAEM